MTSRANSVEEWIVTQFTVRTSSGKNIRTSADGVGTLMEKKRMRTAKALKSDNSDENVRM